MITGMVLLRTSLKILLMSNEYSDDDHEDSATDDFFEDDEDPLILPSYTGEIIDVGGEEESICSIGGGMHKCYDFINRNATLNI